MNQRLEITLVFENEQVQYYKGDIVSDLVPIRVGTASIQLQLENRSDDKVSFDRLEWPGGQPDFIKDATLTGDLIVISDENETDEQRGHFSFLPILYVHEKRAAAKREIPGPDPTIINTDIPGGLVVRERNRRVA